MVEKKLRKGRGESRGEGKGGGRRGREGVGEKVAPATPSSSAIFQKALLLCYLVVALSRKRATIKWGPLAVAVPPNKALLLKS